MKTSLWTILLTSCLLSCSKGNPGDDASVSVFDLGAADLSNLPAVDASVPPGSDIAFAVSDMALAVSDMALAASDMAKGAVGDGMSGPGKSRNQVWINKPDSFSSNLLVLTALYFAVDVPPGVSQGDVEGGISLRPRNGQNKVTGKFSWDYSGVGPGNPFALLVFGPDAPLTDNTDYVISVAPNGKFAPMEALYPWCPKQMDGSYRTILTTGSHPRLIRVRVISKDGVNAIAVAVWFSEKVDTAMFSNALSLSALGMNQAATVQDPGIMQSNLFTIMLGKPIPLAMPLSLNIANGVKAASGKAFDPMSFDSPTAMNGAFALTVTANQLGPCENPMAGCSEWRPTVNF